MCQPKVFFSFSVQLHKLQRVKPNRFLRACSFLIKLLKNRNIRLPETFQKAYAKSPLIWVINFSSFLTIYGGHFRIALIWWALRY